MAAGSRAAYVHARRGVPVRLVGRLGDHRGERTKLQVAQFKLSYSRAFFLRAYPQQTHEMLFDDHNHAFRVLGACRGAGFTKTTEGAVIRRSTPAGPSRVG